MQHPVYGCSCYGVASLPASSLALRINSLVHHLRIQQHPPCQAKVYAKSDRKCCTVQDYWAGKAQRHAQVSEQMRRNLYTMPEDMARIRYTSLPLSTLLYPLVPLTNCRYLMPSSPLSTPQALLYPSVPLYTPLYPSISLYTPLYLSTPPPPSVPLYIPLITPLYSSVPQYPSAPSLPLCTPWYPSADDPTHSHS